MTKRTSFVHRLLLIQISAILIVASLVGFVSYQLTEYEITLKQKDSLAAYAATVATIIHDDLQKRTQSFQQLMADKAVDKYHTSYNELALLRAFETYSTHFEKLTFANERGLEEVVFARNGEDLERADLSSSPLFINAASHPNRVFVIGTNNNTDLTHSANIQLGGFVVNYFGEKIGFVSADLSASELGNALAQHKPPNGMRITISEQNGLILYSSHPLPLSKRVTANFLNYTPAHGTGNLAVTRTDFFDCVDCYVSHHVVPDYGWHVHVSLPHDILISPLHRLRINFMTTAIFISSILFALSFLYIRHVTKPITALTKTAEDIARSGNIEHDITWKSNDELGVLAQTFNTMLERIRQNHTNLRAAQQHTERIIESMADAVIVTDSHGNITKSNRAASDLLGYEPEEFIGRRALSCLASDQEQTLHAITDTLVSDGNMRAIDTVLIAKDKRRVPVSISGALLYETGSLSSGMVFVAKDITTLKQAQAHLNYLANHDNLTGLPNRLLLEDRLQQALARINWRNSHVAVMFLDLDRFKNVNDTLGHGAGDHLLKVVASRLKHNVREGDTVARLGGDEFVIILNDIAMIEDIESIARKVISALRETIELEGNPYTATTSIGISYAPAHGTDSASLLKHADTAMYQAKRAGRNTYQIYDPSMHLDAQSAFHIEVAMHQALEMEQYRVYFQPVVQVFTHRIVGVEALLRWQRPDGTLVLPSEFLPIAEDTGLILPIGRWVLEHACRQVKAWHDLGHADLSLAVNISDRQFRDPDITSQIETIMLNTGFPARSLNLELTEGILMQDIDQASKTLAAFKQLGTTISVDDFGTGYSSLAHLKRFSLDVLKVDRSFISGLPDSPHDTALTEAIIGLARTLKLGIIAEGVENEEQVAFLEQTGADMLQGYLFGKALPAAEMEQLLARQLN